MPDPARPFLGRLDAPSGRGFDRMIQPTPGRRKAVLLADMDSTMIEQEIDELADVAGVARVAAIHARAMNGELNFHGPCSPASACWPGLPKPPWTRCWTVASP